MNRRRKRRLPFAAYAALAFNAAICLTPFIAARAISTAYGDKRPAFEATPEAITATRQAMDARYAMVTVQTDREISNAVATRLGIRHQTPQAIVVKDGRAVWAASHFHVNATEIRKALEAVTP